MRFLSPKNSSPRQGRPNSLQQMEGPFVLPEVPVVPVMTPPCHTYEFLRDNDKYLLRLCENSDWKNVEKCCSILKDVFLARSRKEKDHYEHLVPFCLHQLVKRDGRGNTPLHVACIKNAPVSVIRALFNSASCVPHLELHTLVNATGSTPLVVACKTGASNTLIRSLLHPSTFSNTISVHTSGSKRSNVSYSGGKTVTMYDHRRTTPIVSLVHRYEMNGLKEINYDRMHSPREIMAYEDLAADMPLDLIHEMILAAWKSPEEDCVPHLRRTFLSELHAAAFVADSLPISLIDYMFCVYRDALHASSTILPLHLAVSRRRRGNPTVAHQQAHFIRRLLEVDPSAAKTNMPFSKRSTMAQAAVSGLTWHMGDHEWSTIGPLQRLFSHHPEGVLQRDTETGLFPFQLAAMKQPATAMEEQQDSTPSECDEDKKHLRRQQSDDTVQVDTIYNLLRQSPQLVNDSR